jgi:nicotinamide phosphoribosyltransferase
MRQPQPNLLCDFYKLSHRRMYPEGTELVYSTWTPRKSRIKDVDHVVVFGVQVFIKQYLMDYFDQHFFGRPLNDVVAAYRRVIKHTLGEADPDTQHLESLHELGYLPIEIKALPEGMLCPIRVPYLTIWNTDPRFPWLTNYIESLASCELWQAPTSATIALKFRTMLDAYAAATGGPAEFVQFQGHDFSFRGMSSLQSAMYSGLGHLLSFTGTDTIPAIEAAEIFYNANIEKELVGTSIPATEHSIQCAYADDMAYFRRLISEVHPSGYVSIVSDGYDFWNVVREVLPALKDEIMRRDGKVVIRPDSGDPVKIVTGWTSDELATDGRGESVRSDAERIGAIECLWNIFGGTVNDLGYKELDPHIGLIYGDAITYERAEEICKRLMAKGFASTNVVFGIGSYTYQYNTRDTLGFALKSTFNVRSGLPVKIFKDPKTDDGTKKSQRGRVIVVYNVQGETRELQCVDGFDTLKDVGIDELKTVFRDGELLVDDSFEDVRRRLRAWVSTHGDFYLHKSYADA